MKMDLSLLLFSAAAATGCAGPTTPLGAVWSLTPAAAKAAVEKDELIKSQTGAQKTGAPSPRISFSPTHQVLHGRSPLRIEIQDPTGDMGDYQLAIHYNGLDVTRSFLMRAEVTTNPAAHWIRIDNPLIRLSAEEDHLIEIFYVGSAGAMSYASYEGPRCYAFRPSEVRNLGEFSPSPQLVRTITEKALKSGLSPSFFTALVAQESGFQSQVVSWAHALGLTQITGSAEAEFISRYQNWPRYPGVNDLPVPMLKALVLSGKINARSEWRLDPDHSIQGGIDYTVMLADKWSAPERLARIRAIFPNPEEEHTKLILASYHSGFSRVLNAFERYGRNWLSSPDLREARKYVNRISSYCDYFSQDAKDAKDAEADHEKSS